MEYSDIAMFCLLDLNKFDRLNMIEELWIVIDFDHDPQPTVPCTVAVNFAAQTEKP